MRRPRPFTPNPARSGPARAAQAAAPRHSALALAERVIRQANRNCRADAALSAVLRRSAPPPEIAAEVSRLVSNYYRWRGWVRDARTVEVRLRLARECARRFAAAPESFSEAQLRTRAVPAWVLDQVEPDLLWLRSLQAEPVLWLRARPGQAQALAARLPGAVPRPDLLPDALEYRGTEDLYRHPEFQAGAFEIQDIASQAVGWVCAPQAGETWWDACAGEGGKLLHLSDLMSNRGLIWATDRATWRLARLRRRAARARVFNYRAAVWDGSERLPTRTRFDGVLVDAPCSGVGTWQRHPQARWTTNLEDVLELAAAQQRLLECAAVAVKPGGRLVYAACTLTRAETREVAAAFQQAHPEFEPLPVRLPGSLRYASGEAAVGSLVIWPQDLGGNGMFVAVWRRRPAASVGSEQIVRGHH